MLGRYMESLGHSCCCMAIESPSPSRALTCNLRSDHQSQTRGFWWNSGEYLNSAFYRDMPIFQLYYISSLHFCVSPYLLRMWRVNAGWKEGPSQLLGQSSTLEFIRDLLVYISIHSIFLGFDFVSMVMLRCP